MELHRQVGKKPMDIFKHLLRPHSRYIPQQSLGLLLHRLRTVELPILTGRLGTGGKSACAVVTGLWIHRTTKVMAALSLVSAILWGALSGIRDLISGAPVIGDGALMWF